MTINCRDAVNRVMTSTSAKCPTAARERTGYEDVVMKESK